MEHKTVVVETGKVSLLPDPNTITDLFLHNLTLQEQVEIYKMFSQMTQLRAVKYCLKTQSFDFPPKDQTVVVTHFKELAVQIQNGELPITHVAIDGNFEHVVVQSGDSPLNRVQFTGSTDCFYLQSAKQYSPIGHVSVSQSKVVGFHNYNLESASLDVSKLRHLILDGCFVSVPEKPLQSNGPRYDESLQEHFETKEPICSFMGGNFTQTVETITMHACLMKRCYVGNFPNLEHFLVGYDCRTERIGVFNCPKLEDCWFKDMEPRKGLWLENLPSLTEFKLSTLAIDGWFPPFLRFVNVPLEKISVPAHWIRPLKQLYKGHSWTNQFVPE